MVSLTLFFIFAALIIGLLCYSAGKNKSGATLYKEQLDKEVSETLALTIEKVGFIQREKLLSQENSELKDSLQKTSESLEKTINQKKSSEVRVGLITEQLAPFLNNFPYDARKAYFIGKPIDLIVFDDDGIHFIEVKSGGARLTEVQRRIKEDVENNRITFEVFRVNGE